MINQCTHRIAGLVLCGTLVRAAGALPGAHAGGLITARPIPCQACGRVRLAPPLRPGIDSAADNGLAGDGSYTAAVVGSNVTPRERTTTPTGRRPSLRCDVMA
jgi:hypothetical protein